MVEMSQPAGGQEGLHQHSLSWLPAADRYVDWGPIAPDSMAGPALRFLGMPLSPWSHIGWMEWFQGPDQGQGLYNICYLQ